jgi:hypothetical protein
MQTHIEIQTELSESLLTMPNSDLFVELHSILNAQANTYLWGNLVQGNLYDALAGELQRELEFWVIK